MRALAFVLVAIVPLVVVALGNLCQCCCFGLGILCILAGLAGPTIRVPPRYLSDLRPVNAAQPANVVLVASDVAPALSAVVTLGATRHPVPGTVDPFGIEPNFRWFHTHLGKPIAVRCGM
ncbi:hypothetical protein D3C75_1076590 [compost metagenome]